MPEPLYTEPIEEIPDMTTEIDQIKNILQSILSGYTIDKQFAENAPAVSIEYQDAANASNSKDLIFRLTVKSTSAANLKTAVGLILAKDSNVSNGYNGIFLITSSISVADDTQYTFNAGTGVLSAEIEAATATSNDSAPANKSFLARFDFSALNSDFVVTDGTLSLKAANSVNDAGAVHMYGYEATNGIITSGKTNISEMGTLATKYYIADFTRWTDNARATLTDRVSYRLEDVINEAKMSGWVGPYISFRLYFTSSEQGTDFIFDQKNALTLAADEPILSVTWYSSSYPFYLETKLSGPPIETENEFEQEILLLARWTI
jgi:hypothetical protein